MNSACIETINIEKIINLIGEASVTIHQLIRNSDIENLTKLIDKNPTDDASISIDIVAQNVIIKALRQSKLIYAIASEEEKKPIKISNHGDYLVAIDPLDGSSNISTNGPTGTIFSIYKLNKKNNNLETCFYQLGTNQLASGYALYGSNLIFTTGIGNKVIIRKYDYNSHKFKTLNENFKTNQSQYKYYSINEGYSNQYSQNVHNYISKLKQHNLSLRYTGALVADIHNLLLSGGIYFYPSFPERPVGKLRLLFECNPIALLMQYAGGLSTDGQNNILEIKINNIHQTTSFLTGTKCLLELWRN